MQYSAPYLPYRRICHMAVIFSAVLAVFAIFTSTSPVFTHKILLKKYLEKMLIVQIIELQLRGPGPPDRTCTPITG